MGVPLMVQALGAGQVPDVGPLEAVLHYFCISWILTFSGL